MKKTAASVTAIAALTLGFAAGAAFAEDDAFNQNASRSNHSNLLSGGGGAASASYAATGRAAAGGDDIVEPTESANGVKSPRDPASGLATGKRQHKPLTHGATADADGDGASEAAVQDHNSSRSNKSAAAAPRDAASGLATGKRQHAPATGSPDLDSDNDGVPDADPQGMAINEKGMPGNTVKAKTGKTGSAK